MRLSPNRPHRSESSLKLEHASRLTNLWRARTDFPSRQTRFRTCVYSFHALDIRTNGAPYRSRVGEDGRSGARVARARGSDGADRDPPGSPERQALFRRDAHRRLRRVLQSEVDGSASQRVGNVDGRSASK